MTDNVNTQLPERPKPPPMLYTGTNYVKLLIYAFWFILIAVWIFGLYAYGFIFQPTATLDNGDFLRSEIAFELIPVLPDTLAESYDLDHADQLAQINEYRMYEDNRVSIPIDAALPLFLEQDIAVREEMPAADAAPEASAEEDASAADDTSAESDDGAAADTDASAEEAAPAPEATEEAAGD